jgi:hypothetical protein
MRTRRAFRSFWPKRSLPLPPCGTLRDWVVSVHHLLQALKCRVPLCAMVQLAATAGSAAGVPSFALKMRSPA